MEGIFHDAHEVYAVRGDTRRWVATFATGDMARDFAAAVAPKLPGWTFEVEKV